MTAITTSLGCATSPALFCWPIRPGWRMDIGAGGLSLTPPLGWPAGMSFHDLQPCRGLAGMLRGPGRARGSRRAAIVFLCDRPDTAGRCSVSTTHHHLAARQRGRRRCGQCSTRDRAQGLGSADGGPWSGAPSGASTRSSHSAGPWSSWAWTDDGIVGFDSGAKCFHPPAVSNTFDASLNTRAM